MVAKVTKDSSKKANSQGKAFIKAARAAECDEDEARFAERLKVIAKPKATLSSRSKK